MCTPRSLCTSHTPSMETAHMRRPQANRLNARGPGGRIGIPAWPSGLTCPLASPLVSGVAMGVSVPSGDRWYLFVVAETGVLSTAFTLTGGTGTITGYKNGSCASLPASSFSASATAWSGANISVAAGDVVRIKLTQSTGTLTGSLTATLAHISSIAASGIDLIFTFVGDNVSFQGTGTLAVTVNGSPRWTLADATAENPSGGGYIDTITFATPAIAPGDTVRVVSTGLNWAFGSGSDVPDFDVTFTA